MIARRFRQLADYDALDVADWAAWLRERIEMIDSPVAEQRRRALDFTDEIALEPQEPVVALTGFVQHLHPPSATRLRLALGEVLMQAHPQWVRSDGMALLVILVGQFHAHEAARAMVDALVEGQVWGKPYPTLFVDALSVLKTLGRSPAVAQSAAKIAQSPELPPTLIFDAYEALLPCISEQWGQWFLDLEPVFASVQAHVPPRRPMPPGAWFGERVQRLAVKHIGRLALPVIVDGLLQLQGVGLVDDLGRATLARKRLNRNVPIGQLIYALFMKDDAPLILTADAEGFPRLQSTHAGQRSVLWPDDKLDYLDAHLRRWRASRPPEVVRELPAIREDARNSEAASETVRALRAMMTQDTHRRQGASA